MYRLSIQLVLLIFVLSTFSCKEESKKVVKTEPVVFKKEGELSIFKQRVDTLITSFNIELAKTEYETQTGLMYRESMQQDQAMLFVFPNEQMKNFYMKNTAIPIDIIFIKEDMTIASFQENARPFDESGLSSQVPVKYVLEVNAGLAQKYLLEVGDKIVYSKN